MEKNTRNYIVIAAFCICSLFNLAYAKPNVDKLNPTGYSLEVYHDNAPFRVYSDIEYALPKGLKVDLLGSTIGSLYCQLPDGSRGFIPEYFFEGYTVEISDKLTHNNKPVSAEPGIYDVLSWGSWKFDKELGRYRFEYDDFRLRSQSNGKVIAIPFYTRGRELVRPLYLHDGKLPKLEYRDDIYLVVENPEDISNLAGRSIAEISDLLGHPLDFVGDALTDVGYAYAHYSNVSYAEGKGRNYGLNVYFDKNSECVAAVWETTWSTKKKKQNELKVKFPAAGAGVAPVEIKHGPFKSISRYDVNVVPVMHQLKADEASRSFSYDRFAKIFLVGDNMLSALLTILVLYGFFLLFYQFALKHTQLGSNGMHMTIAVLVGVFFFASGVYGMMKFRIIDMIWGIPLLVFEVSMLGKAFVKKITAERCPRCHYFYGNTEKIVRTGGYETQSRSSHAIRQTYTEIGELNRLNDEQVRRWETVYKHIVVTSQYGQYKNYVVCPHCVAEWIYENDVCENEITDVEGYSKRVREEIWGLEPEN